MEDFQLDLIIGAGPAARSVKIDLARFTLIGATTRAGLLTTPLRDRFGIPVRLNFYTTRSCRGHRARGARVIGLELAADGANEIARRARGTPRIAGRLLRRVRDFAVVERAACHPGDRRSRASPARRRSDRARPDGSALSRRRRRQIRRRSGRSRDDRRGALRAARRDRGNHRALSDPAGLRAANAARAAAHPACVPPSRLGRAATGRPAARTCSKRSDTLDQACNATAGSRLAESHPLPFRSRRARRPRLRRNVRRSANFVQVKPREITQTVPLPKATKMKDAAPAALVADFLDAIAAERGASRNTSKPIAAILETIRPIWRQRGPARGKAERPMCGRILAACGAEGLKAASLARQLSAVRQFHKHLYAEGLRRDDPTIAIEGPRRAPPAPQSAERGGSRQADRRRARRAGRTATDRFASVWPRPAPACLVELLYASGLRVSEALSLPKSAARAREPFLTVRGKGAKERLAPISEPARAAMHTYRALLNEAAPGAATGQWLFPAESRSGHMTRQAFARDLKTARCGRRDRRRPIQPACPAPRLRQPSPSERRRSARRSGSARPRRHIDHADLHPCARRARQGDGARSAPDE